MVREASLNSLVAFVARSYRAYQMLADLTAILTAWWLSYVLRFHLIVGGQSGLSSVFLFWAVSLACVSLYFLSRNGLYDRRRLLSLTDDIMALLKANGFSLLTFIVLLYFGSEIKISRLTIAFYAGLSTTLLISARVLIRSSTRKLRRRGFLLNRVLLVGKGPRADRYLRTVDYTPGTGLKVVAQIGPEDLEAVQREIKTARPDLVVLALESDTDPFVDTFMSNFYDSLFKIQILLSDQRSLVGMQTEEFDSLHLLTQNHPEFSFAETFAKRTLDIAGSGLGLLVLSPFLVLIAIAIRISSEGPVFFGQERVGFDGRRFKMWKFRSMRPARDGETTTGWTIENDPRRTAIGSLIRKTSIDELPQLWNVFAGDMSLVGPRPEQPYFVEKFQKEIPAYMLRHKMRCGITGWAQVNGWRGDTSLHKRIEFDLFYIRNWSIWFDLKILVLTLVRGFVNKNAY